jgi:hypothetical protein
MYTHAARVWDFVYCSRTVFCRPEPNPVRYVCVVERHHASGFDARTAALAAQEMLYVLDAAQQHGTDMDQKVSYQLALAVLADETDDGVLRMMHLCLTKFTPSKQPRSHITDCVEVGGTL